MLGPQKPMKKQQNTTAKQDNTPPTSQNKTREHQQQAGTKGVPLSTGHCPLQVVDRAWTAQTLQLLDVGCGVVI